MESQELNIRIKISEYFSQSELDQWKEALDLRDSIKISNSGSQSMNIKDRQEKPSSHAVRESSENYEAMMMQEFQGIQNRYEGRLEENERRVAQVIGSEARDALRGQRSHMLHEHQVLPQTGEGEKEFVKSQMQLELQSHRASYRRTLQEHMKQHLEFQDAVADCVMASLKESFQENSESARQAVIIAQQ